MKLECNTAVHCALLTNPAGNLKLVSDGRGEEAKPPALCVEHQRIAQAGRCLGRHCSSTSCSEQGLL